MVGGKMRWKTQRLPRSSSSSSFILAAAILFTSAFPSANAVRIIPDTFHEHVDLSSSIGISQSHRIITNATTSTRPRRKRRRAVTSDSNDLPTPDDHLVTSLPLLDESAFPTKHWAGLLPLSRTDDDKHMFYWLFEPDFSNSTTLSKDDPSEVPLLIWLNGGPGCSSMMGLWVENGPFHLEQQGGGGNNQNENNWKVGINPHSWHRIPAWVLYIDQPVGTGFSFTKRGNYCVNDEAVNIDFYAFLQTFLEVYQDYFLKDDDGSDGSSHILNRKLFFSGESHAGHYIPSMMDFLYAKNDDVDSPPRIRIPVAGAALGNPWTDPYHQYAAADIAYGYGFIDNAQKAYLDDLEMSCRKSIIAWMKDSSKTPKHCLELVSRATKSSGGAKSYNINVWGTEYPPGKAITEKYLNGRVGPDSTAIVNSLNLQGSESYFGTFKECKNPPYKALFHQDALGVVDELVHVLDHRSEPRILFYFGMTDFVCNHVSGERMLDTLPWSRAPSWALADRFAWNINSDNSGDNAPAGYVKEFENLALLKIPGAGHMVPMEKPLVTLEMMRNLLGRGCFQSRFQSHRQQLDSSYPRHIYLPGQCVDCPKCEDISSATSICVPSSPPNEEEEKAEEEMNPIMLNQVWTMESAEMGTLVGAIFTFSLLISLYALFSSDSRKDGAMRLPNEASADTVAELT